MRVLLADERQKVRSAVRLLLEQQPDIEVLGEAVDATGLRDWVSAAAPDVVLLDWELPGGEVGELVSDIRQRCPSIKVVALSGLPEAKKEALRAGADAFVSKGDPPERLLEAIRNGSLQPVPGPQPKSDPGANAVAEGREGV